MVAVTAAVPEAVQCAVILMAAVLTVDLAVVAATAAIATFILP